MLNCYYNNNWYFISSIEDFKDIIDKDIYECLKLFIKYNYKDKIKELEDDLYWANDENENLENKNNILQHKINKLEEEIENLKNSSKE